MFNMLIVYTADVTTGQDFLSCPASPLRPGRRQDRTKTKNASCPTGQDIRTPRSPVLCSSELSTGQDFLSCPASSLRPGGRQDRTKIKNASSPTGQDTRTACRVLSSDTQHNKISNLKKRKHVRA